MIYDSSAERWLDEHQLEIQAWLDDLRLKGVIDLEDYRSYIETLYDFPKEGKSIIEDYMLSENQKKEFILNSILNSNYCVGIVMGDPDSGKDTLASWIFEGLYKLDEKLKICYMDTWEIPEFASGPYFDLDDLPDDCIAYSTELAKHFPARDSKGMENTKLSQRLPDLRHFNQKLFGSVQKSALCDINLPRFATHTFFKFMSPLSIHLERDKSISRITELMMPKKQNDKAETLFICKGKYYTLRTEIPKFFTEDFSKNQSKITDEQKISYGLSLIKSNYSIVSVQKKLVMRFKFNKPLSFWEDHKKCLNL